MVCVVFHGVPVNLVVFLFHDVTVVLCHVCVSHDASVFHIVPVCVMMPLYHNVSVSYDICVSQDVSVL